MTKSKIQTTELSWYFHFPNIWEKRHGTVSTMVADLLPRVERSHLWFSENVELLFCAQIAPSCHRSEGSPPVEHLPFDVEGGASGLEPPDVGAHCSIWSRLSSWSRPQWPGTHCWWWRICPGVHNMQDMRVWGKCKICRLYKVYRIGQIYRIYPKCA